MENIRKAIGTMRIPIKIDLFYIKSKDAMPKKIFAFLLRLH